MCYIGIVDWTSCFFSYQDIIEPYLKPQWWMNCKDLADKSVLFPVCFLCGQSLQGIKERSPSRTYIELQKTRLFSADSRVLHLLATQRGLSTFTLLETFHGYPLPTTHQR